VSITAGRLTAYDTPFIQWQTALGTLGVTVVLLVVGYVAFRLFCWIRSAIWGDADAGTSHHEAVSR
jgi:hypothetical protein